MGCYYYNCAICNKSIDYKDKVTLIHVRNNKELGRTTGEYDEYGGVIGDNCFNKDVEDINGHDSIVDSEYGYYAKKGNTRILEIVENGTVQEYETDLSGYIRHCNIDFQMCKGKFDLSEVYKIYNWVKEHDLYRYKYGSCIEKMQEMFENLGTNLNGSAIQTMGISGVDLLFNREIIYDYFKEELTLPYGKSGVIAVHNRCKYTGLDILSLEVSDFY